MALAPQAQNLKHGQTNTPFITKINTLSIDVALHKTVNYGSGNLIYQRSFSKDSGSSSMITKFEISIRIDQKFLQLYISAHFQQYSTLH
jgi:hypothetical protein